MKRRSAITALCGNADQATGDSVCAFRLAFGILLSGIGLLVVACASEPAHQATLGDEIAVGPYVVKIERARNAPNPPPPFNIFQKQLGKKALVVFVYWKTLDGIDDRSLRVAFIETFLKHQLSVADSEGKRIEAIDAMQERVMFMEDPGSNWRDWVVVFQVPEKSLGLTLVVENPEPGKGQARVTAVPLGG